MDTIEKTMLERIKALAEPQHHYFCYAQNQFKTIQDCGKCKQLDEEGHCDYQEAI